jgi:hypothetical protein
VAKDFGVYVPVEIRFAGAPPVVRWIHTGSEPVPFEFIAARRPSEVVFNPAASVLSVER